MSRKGRKDELERGGGENSKRNVQVREREKERDDDKDNDEEEEG